MYGKLGFYSLGAQLLLLLLLLLLRVRCRESIQTHRVDFTYRRNGSHNTYLVHIILRAVRRRFWHQHARSVACLELERRRELARADSRARARVAVPGLFAVIRPAMPQQRLDTLDAVDSKLARAHATHRTHARACSLCFVLVLCVFKG
jgi:hypothetical protein